MQKVKKTSSEEEQRTKDELFLSLDPLERWRLRLITREKMRKNDVNYSYEGMKVTIRRPN